MSTIKIFEKGTKERNKLRYVAEYLNNKLNGATVDVKDIYFDFGQDWWWSTLVINTENDHWQILSPREQEEIVTAKTFDEVEAIADNVIYGRYKDLYEKYL